MKIERKIIRTIEPEQASLMRNPKFREAMENPLAVIRELTKRSLYEFLKYFWPVVSAHNFQDNWHLHYLAKELETVAYKVANRQPREYDLIINVPPGSTKTILVSIVYPVWCWTKWHWMRFITASYSGALSLESAESSRELIRSDEFQRIYPDIDIKPDKDTKSNFKVIKKHYETVRPGYSPIQTPGGYRFSTSVGGTLMGFHADILIVDDPLNPQQAVSDIELENANRWMEQTLPTRKTDKAVTPIILIMQRLHQDDPTGHMLAKQKSNLRHICLPGEIRNYIKQIRPKDLTRFYKDDLFDPSRLPWSVLKDLEADLGQYGYAGQIGQDPTPPGGGMFKVDNFEIVEEIPHMAHVIRSVRYWDKAGTKDAGAYTAGVKMTQLINGRWIVEDVRRGRWSAEKRERIIQETAQQDGHNVLIWIEQEPGSGGKESAEASIRGLAGFSVYADRPTGDKATRADSYSVQVNNGGVRLLKAPWNRDFVEEHRFFPYSTYKDQVDAASGAFNHLVHKKVCSVIY
jgi:predicted phage terminase large subunit-like protein